jgi:WS/DGAT/MGAT family acyltransferase
MTMQQLTALDTQFLAMETESTLGHVAGLAILDPSTAPGGEFGCRAIKDVLRARLHMLPPLTRKLHKVPFGIDRPYWIEDPYFDLDYHVREIGLPAPGSDEQLAEQVARLHSRRLDRARPLWELYVISGLADGNVAIYTKLHHSAVDGVSGAEVTSVLYDMGPEGPPIVPVTAPPEERPADEIPGSLGMLVRGAVRAPLHPVDNIRALPHVLPHVDLLTSLIGVPGTRTFSRTLSRARNLFEDRSDVVEEPALHAPRVPFSGRITPHRRFAFGSVSLTDVKQVKNHFGCTVNDVVMALSAGAARRWLIEHDALPERPVVAMVPVSVRTPEQAFTFGNRVSVMMVELPTHLEDPVDRLRATHATLRSAKDRHNALPAQMLQDVTNFIPPAVHARATRVLMGVAGRSAMRPVCNMVVSNVPGSPIPIYLAGAKMVANYAVSAIAPGTGLNITVMSYMDRVDIGIVACREKMPDLPFVVEGMAEELRELLAIADPSRELEGRSSGNGERPAPVEEPAVQA